MAKLIYGGKPAKELAIAELEARRQANKARIKHLKTQRDFLAILSGIIAIALVASLWSSRG